MVTTHNLGFPRIGASRQLKFALESYWKGRIQSEELEKVGAKLRKEHWLLQNGMDYIPVGDFSFYDHVLDTSFLLGVIPERIQNIEGNLLERYFRVARGRSANDNECDCVQASEMTKWFDTNYHYLVPELTRDTQFTLHSEHLLSQIKEAQTQTKGIKPVILGPLSYLWLSKTRDKSNRMDLLDRLLPLYKKLLEEISELDVEWVQIDEPILVTELSEDWLNTFMMAYQYLSNTSIKLLLTTYFGQLGNNLSTVCQLPVAGIHIDITYGREELEQVIKKLPSNRVLSLGIVNGRNVWKMDLNSTLDWLEPIAERLKYNLWIAPSCSLLHIPMDLRLETTMDQELKSWLSFSVQKLNELVLLAEALNKGRDSVKEALNKNRIAMIARKQSLRVHKAQVKESMAQVTAQMGQRASPYSVRTKKQRKHLKLPLFPTTTIGSFPQTQEIRTHRLKFKRGEIEINEYKKLMQEEIYKTIRQQEKLGLDVLVHGEAERNDMVEYFGEHLDGCAITQFGWVQSYGSRCVKPPVIYGDINRSKTITVEWLTYAQSLTDKPVKGMLTGPVTLLNWSFVRDDQPRVDTCLQLALAMREEVLDLENTGISIIQIDEAALREGLPLKRSQWNDYLHWAVDCFRICANAVKDETQIHSHMCYSEFNDIIESISKMDADVITIETSRSHGELLDVFESFDYPNELGPGVYDIHSPNVPSKEQVIQLLSAAKQCIPEERLWINPDCGLKTRQWEEVIPSLTTMVEAAHTLRTTHSDLTT